MMSGLNRSQPELPTARSGLTWRVRLPFFYGWVVVGSLFLVLTITYGSQYVFSVFYVSLLEEFGWSRAATAGAFSLYVAVIGVNGFLSGNLVDSFGPAKMVSAGGVLLTLGLAAASQVSELWQLYFSYGLMCGLGVSLAGWVPAVAVLTRWFSKGRGAAMGVASAGSGLGIVAIVPLCQYLISTLGWRTSLLALAVLALLVIVPQATFLLIAQPEHLGLCADGFPSERASTTRVREATSGVALASGEEWTSDAWSVASALRTMRFWLLLGSILLNVLSTQMIWVHQVVYMVDSGYEKALAVAVTGAAGLVSIPLKAIWGSASDRVGREIAFTLGTGCLVVAIAAFVASGIYPAKWLLPVFVLCFAAGYAVSGPVTSAAVADVFASPRFGSVYGVAQLGSGIGSATGPWLAGYVFDVTGSYAGAFVFASVCAVASSLCLWIAAPRRVRRAVRQK